MEICIILVSLRNKHSNISEQQKVQQIMILPGVVFAQTEIVFGGFCPRVFCCMGRSKVFKAEVTKIEASASQERHGTNVFRQEPNTLETLTSTDLLLFVSGPNNSLVVHHNTFAGVRIVTEQLFESCFESNFCSGGGPGTDQTSLETCLCPENSDLWRAKMGTRE